MSESIKVWDILIRVFHWSLVIFFILAYLTGEGEGSTEELHALAGYIIIGLLIFRIVWGFIGSKHARFSDFVYSPARIVDYLKSLFTSKPKHFLGHNPAGGAMIILMLISLALASWSGLKAYGAEGKGPLASAEMSMVSLAQADGWFEEEHKYGEHGGGHEDEFWEEVHEVFVNFTLLLIFLHLVGVLVSSVLHGENLVRAMITGRKEKQE